MADPLGDRRAGDCGGIFGARRISSVDRAEPHGVALGLAAGYDGRSNRSGPAVALVPVSFRELCRRSGERCFRNAKLARVYCHNLQPSTGSRGAPTCRGATNPRPLHKVDESSVRRTSVARIPGLSKPIQRDTKGPPRKYGTGPLFGLYLSNWLRARFLFFFLFL